MWSGTASGCGSRRSEKSVTPSAPSFISPATASCPSGASSARSWRAERSAPETSLKNGKVLRISVTDRCDLRCVYCMPETGVSLVPMADMLTYEEIAAVARAAMALGVRRFRLTGGEPLARRGVLSLVGLLSRLGPEDLAMTTNGLRLAECAAGLKAAGLKRVTVSLDTLRRDRFETITRRTGFDRIFEGLDTARAAGLVPIKVNTVVIRGVNDDEVLDFVRFAEKENVEVRFIELMPTSGLSPECKELGSWRPALFVKGEEIRARVAEAFGPLEPVPDADGVADIYLVRGRTRLGFITPVSDPFCRGCQRLRLGPDGRLKICLFDRDGIDVRKALREDKAGPVELGAILRAAFETKTTWERGDLESLSSDMFRIGG
ncbi:MAG: GTP 3',8-cyclase MoaA [Candidatus Aminicenantes bacterium]|nr:MAG: GTP 3',8-cyclase MoaA [Candidatus Aminicenantes bacterium]